MNKGAISLLSDIRDISHLAVSPDGNSLVFTVARADMATGEKSSHIWHYSVRTGEAACLTQSGRDTGGVWADERTLMLRASRSGDAKGQTHFYGLDVTTGAERKLFSVPEKIEQFWPLGGGKYLLRGPKDYNPPENAPNEDWVVHTEYPYKQNGKGFVSGIRQTLFLYDGERLIPVTDNSTQSDSAGLILSPDRTAAWHWGDRYTHCNHIDEAFYRADLVTAENTEITSHQKCGYSSGVFLAGRLYVIKNLVTADHDLGCNELWSLAPDGTDWKKELDLSAGNARIRLAAFDGCLYYTDPQRACRRLMKWTPGEKPQLVLNGDVGVDDFAVSSAGVFIVGRTAALPAELYLLADGSLRRLTSFNAHIPASYGLYPAEPLSFTDGDGFAIDGWCVKPSDYVPDRKYPGVLRIHGGPSGFFDGYFDSRMQSFAAEGYFVFYCNPRGSGTCGREHLYLTGQFGTYDFEDLMMFTDKALEKYPDLDAERLCVTGGSYGGYMTNWVVTHTDRFCAAVSLMSTSNWISKLLCCDDSHSKMSILGATTWEDPEKLWWHSPLRYVENVKTPTLFVQNEHDYRSPPCEAEMMFTSLCRLGIPAKMIMNYNASHNAMNLAQKRNMYEQSVAWFNTWTQRA